MSTKKTKPPKLQDGDAEIGRRTLCVVIDETGHEEFMSKGRFFAIGGIAGFGTELERANRQWRSMKARSFGGADEPLHASGKMLSRQQIDEISSFFTTSRLGRFVYILKQPPVMPGQMNALNILRPILLEELGKAVVDMPTLPSDILLTIERSERLLPKILAAFPPLSVTIDGAPIPMAGLFTPKIPPQPYLEMADQVAWRAQRQYKEYNPKRELMPEFASVFPKGAPHARYREIKVASMSGGSNPKWSVEIDKDERVAARLQWD